MSVFRTKVLGTFAPEERKFHRSESSMERKFLDFSLPGERMFESSMGAKVLSMVFSLPGTKVQRNEKASYPAGRNAVNVRIRCLMGGKSYEL